MRAELGRYPLLVSIAALTVRYWVSILNSPNKLVYEAYLEEVKLDDGGQTNWVSLLRAILTRCNCTTEWDIQRVQQPVLLYKKVTSALSNQYEQVFFSKLQSKTGNRNTSGNKLRTYSKIKMAYKMEQYLKQGFPVHITRAIAKIRVSAHDLEIERGRKCRPEPIPAEQRLCKHCLTEVEDEVHFVIDCPLYAPQRQQLLRNISGLANLRGEALFKSLFMSDDSDVLRQTGIFICRAQNKRKCWLYTN